MPDDARQTFDEVREEIAQEKRERAEEMNIGIDLAQPGSDRTVIWCPACRSDSCSHTELIKRIHGLA